MRCHGNPRYDSMTSAAALGWCIGGGEAADCLL
jgi:hypothetical protein